MPAKFLVIGLGSFGSSVAKTLSLKGGEVVAVDIDRHKVELLRDDVAAALILDATDTAALRSLDLEEIDTAIVGVGERLDQGVLVVTALQELGMERIVVRVKLAQHRKVFHKLGVEDVIFPAEDYGQRVAQRLLLQAADVQPIGEKHLILRRVVPQEFVGKTLAELRLRETRKLSVLTLLKSNDDGSLECDGLPDPARKLAAGDLLLLFGHEDDLRKLP
jgi:trk system potassium uptake protein